MTKHVETIVVGGGQAGLSASWHLKLADKKHIVLDQGKVGDTWRRRWDTFCLVTPNWCCKLPGFAYDGDDPEGIMLRDEIVDYVERFAASFDPPYKSGVEVQHIEQSIGNGRFKLETSDGSFTADNLIIAVGTHQHPNVPRWDASFPDKVSRSRSAPVIEAIRA
jgi:putative flavoprotein involved in K+ transport